MVTPLHIGFILFWRGQSGFEPVFKGGHSQVWLYLNSRKQYDSRSRIIHVCCKSTMFLDQLGRRVLQLLFMVQPFNLALFWGLEWSYRAITVVNLYARTFWSFICNPTCVSAHQPCVPHRRGSIPYFWISWMDSLWVHWGDIIEDSYALSGVSYCAGHR